MQPMCFNPNVRKWQRDRNRRRGGRGPQPVPGQPGSEALTPAIPPDDIGNRVEPEPQEDAPEPNFNTYPAELTRQMAPQAPAGGRRRRRRGGTGAPQQGPRAAAPPPLVPAPPVPQPSAPDSAERPAGAEGGERGGRRRRKRRGRGGRGGPGPRPADLQTRDAASTGALVPVYPEERYQPAEGAPPSAPQQPMSEVSPDLPMAAAPQPGKAPAPRKAKGVVVLAIGLPGSGKSSWFKRRGVTPLSSDILRTLLFDDITEQRYQDLVFSTLRSLLRARMIARMPWNYLDATNLSPKERHGWIKMAREFGYDVHAVFFDVPMEVCLERNQRRSRMVPEDVMQRMAAKLRPPTFEEGFSKIIVVRVKQREEEPTSEVQPQPEAGAPESEEEEGGEY